MPFLSSGWAVESAESPGYSKGGGNWYRLLREIVYEGRHETFVLPVGTLTDYATVPRVFTWLFARDDIYTLVAILHDYLCVEADAGRFSRRDADGIFRRVLREAGVDWVTRWCLWAAVRAGGRMQDGATVKEWAQAVAIGLVVVPLIALPVVLCSVVWGLFWVLGKLSRLVEGRG